MLKLSRRLERILAEIEGESCADIGCDHGKLIVSALKTNRVQRGFAADISKPSLDKARLLAENEEVNDRLTLCYGDGTKAVPENVTVAVVAGMGANEIIHIISDAPSAFAEKWILSPHQDPQFLRRYLAKNGFNVIKDYIIFDKKYYPIIVCKKGEPNYKEKEFFFGKNQPETTDFDDFLRFRTKKLQSLVERLGENVNSETKAEWEECLKWNSRK